LKKSIVHIKKNVISLKNIIILVNMKNILTIFLVFFVSVTSVNIFGQDTKTITRKNQSTLQNEIYASYGLGSVYIFTNGIIHNYDSPYSYFNGIPKNIQSFGTISFGYNRMLNRILMIGFGGSFLNCNYVRKRSSYYGTDTTLASSATFNENILNGAAKLTLNYYNKQSLRIYSSFAFGISIIFGSVSTAGHDMDYERKILPAGQLTMLGIRFGRAFGGFFEFGFGSNAIITGGLSFQLKDSYQGD